MAQSHRWEWNEWFEKYVEIGTTTRGPLGEWVLASARGMGEGGGTVCQQSLTGHLIWAAGMWHVFNDLQIRPFFSKLGCVKLRGETKQIPAPLYCYKLETKKKQQQTGRNGCGPTVCPELILQNAVWFLYEPLKLLAAPLLSMHHCYFRPFVWRLTAPEAIPSFFLVQERIYLKRFLRSDERENDTRRQNTMLSIFEFSGKMRRPEAAGVEKRAPTLGQITQRTAFSFQLLFQLHSVFFFSSFFRFWTKWFCLFLKSFDFMLFSDKTFLLAMLSKKIAILKARHISWIWMAAGNRSFPGQVKPWARISKHIKLSNLNVCEGKA